MAQSATAAIERWRNVSLLDFVPALSPQCARPDHLVRWTGMIEACVERPVRGLCEVPIRHWKTITTMHGAVWILTRKPSWRIIVLTHEHKRAEWWGKRLRPLATAAGVGPARGYDTITDWSNDEGGGVVVMSAEQSALGRDVDVLLSDDPVDEHGAFDPKVRDVVDDTIAHYTARAGSNGRNGSSLIVASPWHPDDPGGRRKNRTAVKWEVVHEQAIIKNDEGEDRAFAPNIMTMEMLAARRAELAEIDPSERLWWAQYMCAPLPDTLGLFRNPMRYTELPRWGSFRTVFGLDLSYSAQRHSDYFALVVLKIYAETWVENGAQVSGERAYVVNAWRERWDPAQAEQIIWLARGMYPGASMYSYMSGPEMGIAHYLAQRGIMISVMPARFSKRHRAQPSIDKSNAGRILFPERSPWVGGMVARMILFSGDETAGDDDEVDALVSGVDGGMMSSVSDPKTVGRRRL